MARRWMGRRLAWRRLARWRLGLGRTGCRSRNRPRTRQRCGVGSRLGRSWLGVCRVGRLYEMAAGLDRLGMARRTRERLLVRYKKRPRSNRERGRPTYPYTCSGITRHATRQPPPIHGGSRWVAPSKMYSMECSDRLRIRAAIAEVSAPLRSR
jgi:hypothetical protein